MAATIGPNDVDLYESPLPDLLYRATGIAPVEAGGHVILADLGVQSAQRLGIGDVGGNVVVGLWPAELKEQAKYLYGQRLGRPMVAAARKRGWTVEPSPHLAFRNASPTLRLYMAPHLDASEYANRWEEGDLERVGAHSRADVVRDLWPWFKSRGYATDSDDRVLEEWLEARLGNRPALLRPGLRLKRTWPGNVLASPGEASALAEEIRSDVDAILGAAQEPALPTRPRISE
jgi:hypothetical protein